MQTYADGRTSEQIENNFKYHPPVGDQADRYHQIRETGKVLATVINELVPSGREKSLAMTKLEECIMHANAGIARNSDLMSAKGASGE